MFRNAMFRFCTRARPGPEARSCPRPATSGAGQPPKPLSSTLSAHDLLFQARMRKAEVEWVAYSRRYGVHHLR